MNDLPKDIVEAGSFQSFKARLKLYLDASLMSFIIIILEIFLILKFFLFYFKYFLHVLCWGVST